MIEIIKDLTALPAVSGREDAVRKYILKRVSPYCETKVDALGNIICLKKGKNRPKVKVMFDAHMDEVGLIITSIDPNGFLRFATVGGIDTSVLICRRVKIGNIVGVIGAKPVHMCSADEKGKMPKTEDLYIDIGAKTSSEARQYVALGDTAVFETEFEIFGNKIKAKALDDRVGCAILINLIETYSDYDFVAVFSVQEEVGLRGAKTATYLVDPDAAIVLEATTAADIKDVPTENTVCSLGSGTAVSFMDKSTVYDKSYYNAALNSKIPVQPKAAVAGGNNSGEVHLTGSGVRTIALSVPCRYIHSPSCLCDITDIDSTLKLARFMLNGIASGDIK